MNPIYFKLLSIFLIFIAAIVGGLIPFWLAKEQETSRLLYYGDYFARGIFLGAGLIHLFPEALIEYQQVFPNAVYPMMGTIIVITFFIIQFIEEVIVGNFASHQLSNHWLAYLLLILLSIHSIVAGVALGFGRELASVLIIFLAIITHKGAASFALTVNMQLSKLDRRFILKIIFLFSFMTPVGVLLGTLFSYYFKQTEYSVLHAYFDAIAAGTFLYIATFKITNIASIIRFSHLWRSISFGLGIALMSIIVLWT